MSLEASPGPNDLQATTPEFSNEPPHFSHPRIPEDIRVPWDWPDLLIFVAITAVSLFVIAIVAVIAFLAFGVHVETIKSSVSEQALISIVTQVGLDLACLGFLAVWTRARYQEPFWQTAGWRKLDMGLLPPVLAGAGFIVGGGSISFLVDMISNAHPPKNTPPIDAVFQDPHTAALFMVMAVTIAPLVEETVFRGFIYPIVAKNWGTFAGILVAGILFGGLHAANLGNAPVQIGLMMIVGIVFTWVRSKSGTTVASYFLHLGYNSFLLIGFLVSSHLLKGTPQN